MKNLFIALIFVTKILAIFCQEQPACEYESFVDALPGGVFGDTSFFKMALKLSGYQDKLPSPSGPIALTMLVPSNTAVLSMLWKNGLFIPILDKVSDALPATVLYNVMVGSIAPEKVQPFNLSNQGAAPSAYGLLGGSENANLGYYGGEEDNGELFYCFQPGMNEGLACAGTPIKVCNSYIYITDEVLVPSDDEKLGGVRPVTIPEGLFNAGSGPEPVTAATTDTTLAPDEPGVVEVVVEDLPAPACVIPSNVKPPVVEAPTAPTVPVEPAVDAPGTPSGSVEPVVLDSSVTPVITSPASGSFCNTTLAEAAKANGLSILSTALSQPAIASQMPDPANPTTYFAPVDTAFLDLLTTLNISINDALALGDKLAGVILYHIHPNEALSIDALGQRDTVTTELGFRINDASQYTVGVESTTTALTLKGLRTGNIATVQKRFLLCGSTVMVIDQVLLPAETLELLPSPGPNVALQTGDVANSVKAEEFALPGAIGDGLGDILGGVEDIIGNLGDGIGDSLGDIGGLIGGEGDLGESLDGLTDIVDGILDGGLASGIGQFINCTINLKAAGSELTTTTDRNGRFAFPGIPKCALADGTLTLPAGLDQLASCVDNSTGLQPPYTLSTLLSTFLDGANSSSPGFATGDFPLNLSPLTNLISSLGLGGDGGNGTFNLTDILGNLPGALGFNNETSAAFGDLIQGLTDGNPDSLANILTNAQSLISSLVGSDVISNLLPGVNIDQAVAAINQIIGTDPEKFLSNLTDPNTIKQLLQSGFDLLQDTIFGGDGSTGGLSDLTSGITGGRKMLQDGTTAAPPTQEELSAIFAAVAQPTALLNKLAKDAAENGSLTPEDIANLTSRCARVAQLRLGPAAADLANGKLSISDFQNSYSDEQVTKAVSMEDTSSATVPQVISAPENTETASSAGVSVSNKSLVTLLSVLFSVALYTGML